MGYVYSISWNLNTWDVFWMNEVLMRQSVVGRWQVGGGQPAGAIRSLVNARSQQLECARVFHESLLVPVLTYGSETII